MRRLRRALQRFSRAFRLTKKFFSLAFLKSRHRDRRKPLHSSKPSSNSLKFSCSGARSIRPPLAMAKCARSRSTRHCGRSSAGLDQFVLLACNPCTGLTGTAGMVVESYKFQIQGKNEKQAKISCKKAKDSGEIWERERSWNIVTQVGDDFVTKKVILKKKSKKNLSRDEDSIDQPDEHFSGSFSSSRYRLSTSSSAADEHQYSWDRELSFASGDDRYFLDDDRYSSSEFPSADRFEACVKDVYIDPLLPVAPANPGAHFLDDSFFSIDHYIRSVQSAGDKHFPSPDCSQRSPPPITVSPSIPSSGSKSISSSSSSPKHDIVDCAKIPMISSEAKTSTKNKVGGVPVAKFSMDPYSDYKDSMLEMSAANGLEKLSEFRELLQCYLSLNPPEFHPTIVEVFTELFWHRLV